MSRANLEDLVVRAAAAMVAAAMAAVAAPADPILECSHETQMGSACYTH